MTRTRRKSSTAGALVDMAIDDDARKKDVVSEVDEIDEQLPEELSAEDLNFKAGDAADGKADDLSFLDDEENDVGGSDDAELNVEEIMGCADEDGKVRLSRIRALAECTLPDDRDEDDVIACGRGASLRRRADRNRPGIEDDIGDEAGGGSPSVSGVVPFFGKDVRLDRATQKRTIRNITARLDNLADYCERSGFKRLAYRLDVISDKLESR